jgi:predicted DNA-binding transcriptional regulator AlpA
MSTEAEILYVSDLARKMGRSEAAIRMAVSRGVDWLPKPMTNMGRRLCWMREDVQQFLASRRDGGSKNGKA